MPLRNAWRQSSSTASTVSGKKGCCRPCTMSRMRSAGDHQSGFEAALVLAPPRVLQSRLVPGQPGEGQLAKQAGSCTAECVRPHMQQHPQQP
eukprot:6207414-Pleurochrysis_carterae.AAC.2